MWRIRTSWLVLPQEDVSLCGHKVAAKLRMWVNSREFAPLERVCMCARERWAVHAHVYTITRLTGLMWPMLMNAANVADTEWHGDKKKTLFSPGRLHFWTFK